MNLKQSLHSLLSDNQTAEVIKQVRSLTENKLTGLHNELEQISLLFEQNEEESRLEFADETTTNKINAKIKYNLLSIINRLPDDAELPSVIKARQLKIAGVIVAVVLSIAGYAIYKLDLLKTEDPPTVIKPAAAAQPNAVVAPVDTPIQAAALSFSLVDTSKMGMDSLNKTDTLRKKRPPRLRVKPQPPVVMGDTFRIN